MINDIQFPVETKVPWTAAELASIPDAYLNNWLLDTGSLTERLQSHCRRFDLQLLGQRQMQPELEELQRMNRSNSELETSWQIREVILYGDGNPWVFARSVLPDELCRADLAELGNKPLGKIIFNDPRFKRSSFDVCCIVDTHPLSQQLHIEMSNPLWGRRSVFRYLHHSMMVAEIFLPDSPAYQHMNGVK